MQSHFQRDIHLGQFDRAASSPLFQTTHRGRRPLWRCVLQGFNPKKDYMTTKSYRVDEVEDMGISPCSCSNCNWAGPAQDAQEIGSCALTPGDPSPVGRCPECDCLAYIAKENPQYWVKLRAKLKPANFWRLWNLEYTKRVLKTAPGSPMASSLLSCWPERVQRALRLRFNLKAGGSNGS